MTRTKFSQTTGYFAPLAGNKYMLSTTSRRDGTGVSTPVHVVVDGGSWAHRLRGRKTQQYRLTPP